MGERLGLSSWLPGYARRIPVRARELDHAVDLVSRAIVPWIRWLSVVRGGDGTVLFIFGTGGRAGLLHGHGRELRGVFRGGWSSGSPQRGRGIDAVSGGSDQRDGFIPRRLSLRCRSLHLSRQPVSLFDDRFDSPEIGHQRRFIRLPRTRL